MCSTPLWASPLWKDPHWLKLLHYKKSLTGEYLSQADGKSFFLSPIGNTSPEEELNIFIRSLSDLNAQMRNNLICRFPARFRWLVKKEILPAVKHLKCEELEAFRQQVAAQSVAVVFSSYYLNNPVSSFGHTFIRLGKNQSFQPANELLDTGVNFSAQTGSANAIEYIVKGLSGGFPGEFRAVPYYVKVKEYNDSEQRDLWSYELNLNQEEIDFLVDHLWELKDNYFEYFFLTENCSYHILSLLEATRPELNLTDKASNLFVIPAETLKILSDSGLIKSMSFRPSPLRVSTQMNLSLSDEKRDLIPKIINEPSLAKNYNNDEAALLLDAALSNFEFENQEKVNNKEPEILKQKRDLLLTRAQIPVSSRRERFDHLLDKAPHLGHGPGRFLIGTLIEVNQTWMTFGYRPAQHNILDNETSYLPKTTFEMLTLLGKTNGDKFVVEEFSLIDLMILQNFSDFSRPISWKFKAGSWGDFYQNKEIYEYGLSGGVGLSIFTGLASPYVFTHVENVFEKERRIIKTSLGLDSGVIIDFSPGVKLHSMFGLRDYHFNESFFLNEFRISNAKYGGGVKNIYYLDSHHQELHLQTFFFF